MKGKEPAPELEEALRRALSEQAGAIEVEPDALGLAGRIAREGARASRHAKRMLAAAVVLFGAVVGGSLAAWLTPDHPSRSVLSVDSGNQGGALPTGPAKRSRRPAEEPAAPARPPVVISGTGLGGTSLESYASWLSPVSLSSGAIVSACTDYEIVSTTATADGRTAGGVGVIGIQPLDPTGIEVVDSGATSLGGGSDLWWVTVAVGPRVSKVAVEQPGGRFDTTRPVDGVTVLGGTAPAAEMGRFFSVVGESASGQGLNAIGFLVGWGPKAAGVAASTAPLSRAEAEAAALHCSLRAAADVTSAGTSGSQPSSPLLSASSVVAAFHQAYDTRPAAGLDEDLGSVAHGAYLARADLASGVATGARNGARTTRPKASGTVSADQAKGSDVSVAAVAFVSAERAAVVFKLGNGHWQTGTAVLGSTGVWMVGESTFCSDVVGSSGTLAMTVSPALRSACGRVLGG